MEAQAGGHKRPISDEDNKVLLSTAVTCIGHFAVTARSHWLVTIFQSSWIQQLRSLLPRRRFVLWDPSQFSVTSGHWPLCR
jgi:hypothetical protein